MHLGQCRTCSGKFLDEFETTEHDWEIAPELIRE